MPPPSAQPRGTRTHRHRRRQLPLQPQPEGEASRRPAKVLRFPGLRDFSGTALDSLVPLRSPSPRSGFGAPPASLPGAAAGKKRTEEEK